jgi:hypothetical protein
MVVVIKRSDSVSVLSGQVGPTDRDIWQFCIETLTVDLLIPLVQVHVVDGLTRVSVASAEKNYHDGNYGDRDLEEAAHLKRVVGVPSGRNSTDVLFEWPAKNFVLMGRDCLARGNPCRCKLPAWSWDKSTLAEAMRKWRQHYPSIWLGHGPHRRRDLL